MKKRSLMLALIAAAALTAAESSQALYAGTANDLVTSAKGVLQA